MAVRLRQLFITFLIVAGYLCTGAAWKVWMVVRHPPGGPFTDAIQNALAPYSSLPVGYALGPRFGRLAWSLRMAAHASDSEPADLKEAVAIDRDLARSRGAWSDVAAYALASLEEKPGVIDPHSPVSYVTFILALDEQRWGRTTLSRSGSLQDAVDRYRALTADFPASPAAPDALLRLAELERGQWEFVASDTCAEAARSLQPLRHMAANNPLDARQKPSSVVIALAAHYVEYLKASPERRRSLARPLAGEARAAGDLPLYRWLNGVTTESSSGLGSAQNPAISITWLGKPVVGAHAALLVVSSLRTAALSQMAIAGQVQKQTHLSLSAITQNLDSLNPARPDDPLHAAAAAILSPERATPLVRRLPGARTGPDGIAHFGSLDGAPMGVTILLNDLVGPDVCLAPFYPAVRQSQVRFVPRVTVLPPILSPNGPPTLRWLPYPGAVRYRVAVALEPSLADSPTEAALSPDWDRRVLWWKDDVTGAQTVMNVKGFVGPSGNLSSNGLWVGWVYRVMITAQDGQGRPLATSIGLQDHPEEFFRVPVEWLALDTTQSRAPARSSLREWRFPARPFAFRGRQRGPRRTPFIPSESDPLEKVLEAARALAPAAMPGSSAKEADLTPVPAHSAAAVPLARWPSAPTEGQGPIPLQDPFLRQFAENPSGAGGAGGGLPFGLP